MLGGKTFTLSKSVHSSLYASKNSLGCNTCYIINDVGMINVGVVAGSLDWKQRAPNRR